MIHQRALVYAFIIAMMIIALWLLSDCSSDYSRERNSGGMKNGVITDLHKYCLEFPKDAACQGKESK
jgi:hypothetical protein